MSARLAILGGREGKPGEWNAVLRVRSLLGAVPLLLPMPPLSWQLASPGPTHPAGTTQGAQKGCCVETCVPHLVGGTQMGTQANVF